MMASIDDLFKVRFPGPKYDPETHFPQKPYAPSNKRKLDAIENPSS